MNIFFEHLPSNIKGEMYAFLRDKYVTERKADMTDEQFYYKTRKNVIGPFKHQTWHLPVETRKDIQDAWEFQFTKLFKQLGLEDTRRFVDHTIKPVSIAPDLHFYLGEVVEAENVTDLAD